MHCCDCRYYKVDSCEYPCSDCADYDMYIEDDGIPISRDTLLLISEVRELKKLIQKLIEER